MAQYWIAGTLKGDLRAHIQPSNVSWQSNGTVLDPGRGSFTIDVNDENTRGIDLWDLTEQWRNTIVVTEGDETLYAGTIIRSPLHVGDRTIRVETREVGVFLGLRMLYQVGNYDRGTMDFKYRSLRGVAIESIHKALGLGSERWNLPIYVPASESGNRWPQYVASDFATAAEWLEEQVGQDGGPVCDLYPTLTGDKLQWNLQVGNPRLDAGTVEVNVAAQQSPITNLVLDRDGSHQRTGVFSIGNGAGKSMIHGEAAEPSVRLGKPDMPFIDGTVPMKEEKSVAKANARAKAELARWINGERGVAFDWTYGDGWAPLKPHMTVNLYGNVAGLFDLDAQVRVLSVGGRGDTTQQLTLEAEW